MGSIFVYVSLHLLVVDFVLADVLLIHSKGGKTGKDAMQFSLATQKKKEAI